MWRGVGHMAHDKWMARRRVDRANQRGGGGWLTHGSQGKVDWKMTKPENGPRWLNIERLRRAELFKHRRSGRVDPGRRKLHLRFRTPPFHLKVERRGGSGMVFITINLGTLIRAVGEVHPRFRTPLTPPA
jgi:hypothetical protein